MRKYVLPLLVLAVLGSACEVKIVQATIVEADGSGQIVLDVLLDEELRDLTGFEDAASALELAGGIPDGYAVEDLVEEDFAGARAVRLFENLDELNVLLADATGAGLADEVSLTREGNEYRYAALIGDLGAAVDGAGLSSLTADTFDDLFNITLSLQLPGDVVDHNADEVLDDGTLVWRLGIDDSGQSIDATSRVATDWAAGAILGILGLAAVAGGVLWVRSRRPSEDAEVLLSDESAE